MSVSFEKPRNGCCFHINSTTTAARQHQLTIAVEEKFNKLRGWEATPSTSSADHSKTTVLCNAFCGLSDLYESVEALHQLPHFQQAILAAHGCENWAKDLLDESLWLLDVCSVTSDVIMQMKEHVQDLRSAFRRRRGSDSSIEEAVSSYFSVKKKMKKQIEKCLKTLKIAENKRAYSPLLNNDEHTVVVISVLSETTSITVSIFESLLSFILGSRPKTGGRSMVSKWMGTRRVVWEREEEKLSVVEKVDASLCAFFCQSSQQDFEEVKQVQILQKQLEALDLSIQGLGDCLECLFRRLIRMRFFLLNILNN